MSRAWEFRNKEMRELYDHDTGHSSEDFPYNWSQRAPDLMEQWRGIRLTSQDADLEILVFEDYSVIISDNFEFTISILDELPGFLGTFLREMNEIRGGARADFEDCQKEMRRQP